MRWLALVACVPALAACGRGATDARPRATVLRLPYPVQTLSAEATRVAVGAAEHSPQLAGLKTPPFVVWNAASGAVTKLPAGRCAQPERTTLAGGRVAFVCRNACCDTDDQRVVVVARGRPRVVVFHGVAAFDGGPVGPLVSGLAGDGGTIAFSTEVWGRRESDRVFRIDGARTTLLARGPRAGVVQDVHNALIVVRTRDGRLVVLRRNGSIERRMPATLLPQPPHPDPAQPSTVVFDGRALATLEDGGVSTTRGRWLPVAPGAALSGSARGLVAYTTSDAVHVVRVRDGRDARFGLGTGYPAAADITTRGLFYATNSVPLWSDPDQANGAYKAPSRIVFVPLRRVLARLAR